MIGDIALDCLNYKFETKMDIRDFTRRIVIVRDYFHEKNSSFQFFLGN